MTLIKSISGIRGTIGGAPGEGLSPVDIVRFVSAYAVWIRTVSNSSRCTVVVGRDARVSGEMVSGLVNSTLSACGINVKDMGMAATPTVEIAVGMEKADGGIILTASHNPGNWNALKLLNGKGEFISAADGEMILQIAAGESFSYASVDELGTVTGLAGYNQRHIERILELPLVRTELIRSAGLTVAIDTVNSVGGIVLPMLLESLGVKRVVTINGEADGRFAHNPEPLPENLVQLRRAVLESEADVGFIVDPDVDRLAIVSENGELYNEEYTLVSCADYVLAHNPGVTVSNMSSSRALRDVTESRKGEWYHSAVGEVNVVTKMKEKGAVIGGEGNGGIIYPGLHYGRDALVGIALFLSHLALSGKSCSELRKGYPDYYISKNRVEIPDNLDTAEILRAVENEKSAEIASTEDGILIENSEGWVHLRRSNTESILRVYSEARSEALAEKLSLDIIKIVKKLL